MAVLEGPDLKISRVGMPPDPPIGSCMLALGPLFTNFLDPPLGAVVFGNIVVSGVTLGYVEI